MTMVESKHIELPMDDDEFQINHVQLLEVQTYWQVPYITHFFHVFGSHLKSYHFFCQDLEAALLDPDHEWDPEGGRLLDEIVITLVLAYYDNNLPTDFYTSFRKMIVEEFIKNDKIENPLVESTTDHEGKIRETWRDINSVPMPQRIDLIQRMCDYVISFKPSFVSQYEPSTLRVSPVGKDSKGFIYWYFHGNRLYRQKTKALKVSLERLPLDTAKSFTKKIIRKNGSIESNRTKKLATKSDKRSSKIDKKIKNSPRKADSTRLSLSSSEASGSRCSLNITPARKSPKSSKKSVNTALKSRKSASISSSTKTTHKKTKASSKIFTLKIPTSSETDTSKLPLPVKQELWTVICDTPLEWERLVINLGCSEEKVDKDVAIKLSKFLPQVRDAFNEKELEIQRRDKVRSLRFRRKDCIERRKLEIKPLITETRLRSNVLRIDYTEMNGDDVKPDENKKPVTEEDESSNERSDDEGKGKKEPLKGKNKNVKIRYTRWNYRENWEGPPTYHEKKLLRALRKRPATEEVAIEETPDPPIEVELPIRYRNRRMDSYRF